MTTTDTNDIDVAVAIAELTVAVEGMSHKMDKLDLMREVVIAHSGDIARLKEDVSGAKKNVNGAIGIVVGWVFAQLLGLIR